MSCSASSSDVLVTDEFAKKKRKAIDENEFFYQVN